MLSDPKKRQLYDQTGLKGLQEGGQDRNDLFHKLFFQDFFDNFGPNSGGRRRAGLERGEDTVHSLKVTLEDMYNGKTSKLQLSKNVICASCTGKGTKAGVEPETCKNCDGSGVEVTLRPLGHGMMQQVINLYNFLDAS